MRQEPLVATRSDRTQRYVKLTRERDFEAVDPWFETGVRCGIPERESFAPGLHKDEEAIKAALLLSSHKGPGEGQVNRFTFVKRSLFGRGRFELLRQRFLGAA